MQEKCKYGTKEVRFNDWMERAKPVVEARWNTVGGGKRERNNNNLVHTTVTVATCGVCDAFHRP
jgi:hypothetical protein